jgi:hypothetical protein
METPLNTSIREYAKGKTLAVIGNAKFSEPLGKEIDACDIVVRMNSFQLPRLSNVPGSITEQIGTKFTVWTFNNDFNQSNDEPWPKRMLAARAKLRQCDAVLWQRGNACQYPRTVENMLRGKKSLTWKGFRWPKKPDRVCFTTGFRTFFQFYHTEFKSMLMCGFRGFDDPETFHMWQNSDQTEKVKEVLETHDPDFERGLIKELVEARKEIRFIQHK